MKHKTKKKLQSIVGLYLIILFAIVSVTVIALQKISDTRSRASGTAVLSFSSTADLNNIPVGTSFPLDIIVDPTLHAISFVSLDISYDPLKLELDSENPFQINSAAFPVILEGPLYNPGVMKIRLSVGSDPVKVITAVTKVGTLNFKAREATIGSEALVKFDTTTIALSVSSNSNADENVLGSLLPAYITIPGIPLPTSTPPVEATQVPTVVLPYVSISSPRDSSMVRKSAKVSIKAIASSVNGISKVEFYVDNVLLCTDTTRQYACAWRVPATAGAIYTLQAKVYDGAGLTNSSYAVVRTK